MKRLLPLALLALAVGACRGRGGHLSGTPGTDEVFAAWEKAGLAATDIKPFEPSRYGAGFCAQARVNGLEALVCEYADDAALVRGKQQLEQQWDAEKVRTGVTVRAKRTLVGLTDRANSDTQGRTLGKLITVVRKL